MELAQRFRELRIQKGLTQTALARPRYSVSYVSQIEAGRRKPSPQALGFFAARLGVTPEFLATGVPEDLEVSLRYALESAREALRGTRPADAEAVLRPVISQAEQYGLQDIGGLALVLLGESLFLSARYGDSVDAYEEALELDLSAAERGQAVGGLARAYPAV